MHKLARFLLMQESCRSDCQAIAAKAPTSFTVGHLHETSDTYVGTIARLCSRHRVIVCKDGLQWILQHRKNGGAERPWRGIGYFLTRDALIRVSATLCDRIDPSALASFAALPDVIGRSA